MNLLLHIDLPNSKNWKEWESGRATTLKTNRVQKVNIEWFVYDRLELTGSGMVAR